MPAGTAKASPKKPLPPKPSEPLTQAEIERREKFREYGRKGGLARKSKNKDYLKDKSKAFDVIREKWIELADSSVDEALRAVRDNKTDPKQLVGKVTAGAIGYDKAFKGHTDDSQEIEIPPSLVMNVQSKMYKPLISNESECMTQGKPCTEEEAASETTEPAPDPMLLSPGL